MSSPAQPSLEQALLAGRWRLISKVGAGGMGSVHLARDEEEGRMVAVKLLSQKLSAMPEYVERFEREARVMATFTHENLVRLFGTGVHEGTPFLVMELLTGRPLDKVLRPKLPLAQSLAIIQQLCSGLTVMHERNFIHRDLKPPNIFLSDDGHVTILDFGIARQAQSTLTKTGIVFGSPSYMSPEQIVGDKNLDPRSDVYSLGVVLYEMLTGTVPFKAQDEHQLLLMHLRDPPPEVTKKAPEVPRGISIAIQRAMSKTPEERFPTAEDFWHALAGASARVALPVRAGRTRSRSAIAPPILDEPSELRTDLDKRPLAAKDGERTPVPDTPPALDATTHPTNAPESTEARRAEAPTREHVRRTRSSPSLAQAAMAAGAMGATAGGDRLLGLRILQGVALAGFVAFSAWIMVSVLRGEEDGSSKPVKVEGTSSEKAATQISAQPLIPDELKPLQGIENAAQIETLDDRRKKVEELAAKAEANAAEKSLTRSEGPASIPRADGMRRANPGELRVTATVRGVPVSALVAIDGKARGRTPLYLPLKAGLYEFKVVFAGVKPWGMDLVVDTYKGQNFEVELDEKYLERAAMAPSPEDRPIPQEQ